jgi:hypothetical protein
MKRAINNITNRKTSSKTTKAMADLSRAALNRALANRGRRNLARRDRVSFSYDDTPNRPLVDGWSAARRGASLHHASGGSGAQGILERKRPVSMDQRGNRADAQRLPLVQARYDFAPQ